VATIVVVTILTIIITNINSGGGATQPIQEQATLSMDHKVGPNGAKSLLLTLSLATPRMTKAHVL